MPCEFLKRSRSTTYIMSAAGTGNTANTSEEIKRITVGIIGLDIVVLKSPEQITTALQSGDLKRLQVLSETAPEACQIYVHVV